MNATKEEKAVNSKKIRNPKSYEMIVNLDNALYIINKSAYVSLIDSVMRGQDDIGDTPFGCLYEVDYDRIYTSDYLSKLPAKSSPFKYVAEQWKRR